MTTEEAKPPEDDDTPPAPPLANFVVPSYAPRHPNRTFTVWKWITISVVTLVVVVLVMSLWGHARWVKDIAARVQALEAASPASRPQRYFDTELEGLPPVVQRYFSKVLNPNQPIVRGLYLEQSGSFNRSNTPLAQWEPFTARQRVTTKRPGFVWDAAIVMSHGVTVRVVDAYVAGVGSLQPSVLGLIDIGGMQGTGEIARGELIRYVAESVWYPTVLLPSQGVLWKPVDSKTAQATLTDGPLTVNLRFEFNADDTVKRITSTERSALVDGVMVPTPWEVLLSNYQQHSGMLVPMHAEVAWLTPTGRMPYWRGKVERLDYEMPR